MKSILPFRGSFVISQKKTQMESKHYYTMTAVLSACCVLLNLFHKIKYLFIIHDFGINECPLTVNNELEA